MGRALTAFYGAVIFLSASIAIASESEQRVALVIGNSAYKESPLSNPGNDAADMAKALGELGFKVILRRNANTRAMREAIREFGKELRRAQVGLFYYAGHGVQIRGSNYLIPVGADIRGEADVEDQAIDATYALRTMEEAQAKVNIVILDACRNNPYTSSFRSASRGLAQMTAATGTLIAFSTAPGSIAADGTGRNGLYTQHLLASLRQPDTHILKVFQRTRAGVVKDTGGKQTPWESTSLTGDFYFRPGTQLATAAPSAAAIPALQSDPIAIELAFWDSIKDSKSIDEIKVYLERYPRGQFAELARVRIKALENAAESPVKPQAQVALAAPQSSTTSIEETFARLFVGKWTSSGCNNPDATYSAYWMQGDTLLSGETRSDKTIYQKNQIPRDSIRYLGNASGLYQFAFRHEVESVREKKRASYDLVVETDLSSKRRTISSIRLEDGVHLVRDGKNSKGGEQRFFFKCETN